MTMTLKIQNAVGPYIAQVQRGGVDIVKLDPGESADVTCWAGEGGELRIVEVGKKE